MKKRKKPLRTMKQQLEGMTSQEKSEFLGFLLKGRYLKADHFKKFAKVSLLFGLN